MERWNEGVVSGLLGKEGNERFDEDDFSIAIAGTDGYMIDGVRSRTPFFGIFALFSDVVVVVVVTVFDDDVVDDDGVDVFVVDGDDDDDDNFVDVIVVVVAVTIFVFFFVLFVACFVVNLSLMVMLILENLNFLETK